MLWFLWYVVLRDGRYTGDASLEKTCEDDDPVFSEATLSASTTDGVPVDKHLRSGEARSYLL